MGYFIEVRADMRRDPSVRVDAWRASQLVAAAVHSANFGLDPVDRLGLAFPRLVEGDAVPAGVIRVIGQDAASLDRLLASRRFAELASQGAKIRGPAEVPADATLVSFVRQRAAEGASAGGRARAARRAARKVAEREARGETVTSPPLPATARGGARHRAGLLIWLESASTGEIFPLVVDAAPCGDGALDSYGLSSAQGTGTGAGLPHWNA